MSEKLSFLSIRLNTLTIFRGLLEDPVISRLQKLLWLAEKSEDMAQAVSCYSAFVSILYESTPDLSRFLLSRVLNDENFYVRQKAAGNQISQSVEFCLAAELELMQELSQLRPERIRNAMGYPGFLPSWENSPCDIKKEYRTRMKKLSRTGYGIFSRYHAFSVKNGKIIPIKFPDSQSLSDLFGYERERKLVIKNTESFLSGRGASDMLLYGDAGTGKSSTIKAVANAYAVQGLRLVEIKKNQLSEIPDITERLSSNPLKFIIYIDDLSFSGNDENFSALKAILEGSASTRGKNIIIYATSNRRHLIKENAADRSGDDIHINETLQETMSLAARFGLMISYQQPDKEEYLEIVKNLAEEYGLDMPEEELFRKAEAHAIYSNGRTPRTAKQFVELEKIGI